MSSKTNLGNYYKIICLALCISWHSVGQDPSFLSIVVLTNGGPLLWSKQPPFSPAFSGPVLSFCFCILRVWWGKGRLPLLLPQLPRPEEGDERRKAAVRRAGAETQRLGDSLFISRPRRAPSPVLLWGPVSLGPALNYSFVL